MKAFVGLVTYIQSESDSFLPSSFTHTRNVLWCTVALTKEEYSCKKRTKNRAIKTIIITLKMKENVKH